MVIKISLLSVEARIEKKKQNTTTNKPKKLFIVFSFGSRFYLRNCFRIFLQGVLVEKYLLVNSRSDHSDKPVSPKTLTIA